MEGPRTSYSFSAKIPRGDVAEPGSPNVLRIDLFNATQIIGCALLVAVFLTAWLSPGVRRSSAWFSFIAVLISNCISYLLLLGRQSGPEPGRGICLFQSMLIYAGPALTAYATLTLEIQLYLAVLSMLKQETIVNNRRTIFLLLLPYVIYIIICLEVLALGLQNPNSVERTQNGIYCHLTTGTPTKITAALAFPVALVMLGFEISMAITLYRNWDLFRSLSTQAGDVVPLSTIIRISIFGFLPMVSVALDLTVIANTPESSGDFDIVIGTYPILAALVFGSQRDILRAWRFWRKD